jgi:hypothetical protein
VQRQRSERDVNCVQQDDELQRRTDLPDQRKNGRETNTPDERAQDERAGEEDQEANQSRHGLISIVGPRNA